MAPEKVTVMILNVDLKCPCCYKKVKKVLSKFPQIRDQVFDEDKNKVRITVVCCNPEKVRDKLCCKGGKAIQSIEILEDIPKPKPKPEEKPKSKPEEKPKPDPKPEEKPPVVVPVPTPVQKSKPEEKPKPDPKHSPPVVVPVPTPVQKTKPEEKPKPDPKHSPPVPVFDPQPGPMQGYCPPAYPVPIPACCQECYEGRGGGPCHDFGYNYERPVPPPPGPCYDGYGYQYGPNRPCYDCRCDYYFSEENPQGCSIM